jgi:hypothetical protein
LATGVHAMPRGFNCSIKARMRFMHRELGARNGKKRGRLRHSC